jgi:hypothetical protein
MKGSSAALLVLIASAILLAQQPEARPPQDPKAVALLERLDSLLYIPRSAGLKDLEFIVKLPVGFQVIVKWKAAPDRARADLVVPPETPATSKKQLEILKPTVEAEARKRAMSFATTQIGEVLRDRYKDDEIILLSPNQVKIVARSAPSLAAFKEHTITFNDLGLVTMVKVVAPTGREDSIEPTFTEWNGKQLYRTLKTTIGRQETLASYEYVDVGAFRLVKKITTTVKGQPPEALEFDGFKVNAGIDDAAFEEK